MFSEAQFLPLDGLVTLQSEKVAGQKDPNIPYIGLEHMAQGEPTLLGTVPSNLSTSVNSIFKAGDILFGKLRPNLRKSLQVKFDGYCSTDILIFRARPGVLPEFVSKVFQNEALFEEAVRTAEGTKMPRTAWDKLRKFHVFVPSHIEQLRIAQILDALNTQIQETERLIVKLKQVKAGLLHDLLTKGIDEHGEVRDPVAHPEEFKRTMLGLMPREWNIMSIDSLATYVGSGITPTGGSSVYQKDGVIFIRSQNVSFDGLLLDDVVFIDKKTHERMKRSEIFAHDILLNITGASIGRCCPFPEKISPANVNQHVCAVRLPHPNQEDAIILSSILSSYIGQSQIERLNAGGNREGLNYQQIRSFVIPWPIRSERVSIARIIEAHNMNIRIEESRLSKLEQMKKGLMLDLLTGIVRVTKLITNDEQ